MQRIFGNVFIPRILEKDLTDNSNESLLQQINRDDNIDLLENTNIDNTNPESSTPLQNEPKQEKTKPGRRPGSKNRSANEIDMEKYDKEQNRIQTRRMRLDSQKSKDI